MLIEIIVSFPNKKTGRLIADELLKKRLAACVQITGPAESRYWWQGNREVAREYLCFIKTRKALFQKVVSVVRKMHPYETPQIVAVSIVQGEKSYLSWMKREIKNS